MHSEERIKVQSADIDEDAQELKAYVRGKLAFGRTEYL